MRVFRILHTRITNSDKNFRQGIESTRECRRFRRRTPIFNAFLGSPLKSPTFARRFYSLLEIFVAISNSSMENPKNTQKTTPFVISFLKNLQKQPYSHFRYMGHRLSRPQLTPSNSSEFWRATTQTKAHASLYSILSRNYSCCYYKIEFLYQVTGLFWDTLYNR